jgi:hypothetical protein
MACLSILRDNGQTTVVADSIFPLASFTIRDEAEIRFEVLEKDADELKSLVGKHQCFYIDETSGVFWAGLKCLNPCISTHRGLALLRDKPTLCGVLTVVMKPPTGPQ